MSEITEPLAQKMEWNGAKKKPSVLFVHFDKNIYTSNEHVWFTAYLLSTKVPFTEHHTLAVSLVRDDDSTVLTTEKFVMVNARAFGHMVLPDSLLPGNYTLLACTNVLADGQPMSSFVQPITIKSAIEPGFIASLKMAEKILPGIDSVKLTFKAFAKDIHTLTSYTDISYTLGNGNKQVNGRLKTDIYGEATFKVPVKQLDISNNRLRLKATFHNETKRLQLALPVNNNNAIVRFFPEGGYLINGNRTEIGWEVSDVYGEPMQISAILFRNEKPVDTIQTNGYGMGRFTLKAETAIQYHVKLIKSGQELVTYPLPAAVTEGLSISVADAVCSDTLFFRANDKTQGIFYGMIHNYTENFISFLVDMRKAPARSFRVALAGIPKGINTLTILDSLGRPVAERLFFAHYNERTEVQITTAQADYPTRENIKLKVQLKNKSGEPVNGLVSIACVQNNRIDVRKVTDIESYHYLNNELAALPFKKDPMGNEEDNLGYWEDILLIKGWRRYTWPELQLAERVDTIHSIASVVFKGNVTRSGKPVKKPVSLATFTDQGLQSFLTDSSGKFVLEKEKIITLPDKKVFIYNSDRNKSDHNLEIKDPYLELSKKLAASLTYGSFDAGQTEKTTENMVLKKGERAETLAEVIVRSNKKDDFVSFQKNACGDYVCMYHILNCPNHPFGGTLPVTGQTYRTGYGLQVTYAGCVPVNNSITSLKGIYTVKEFYNTDYTKLNPSEQVFLSTIFWDYSVPVNTEKPTEFSFYTSDIPGKFKVIVQGVTTNGVVHGEYMFNVVKKDN